MYKSCKWSNEASQDPSRGDHLFQGNAFAQHRAPRSVAFPTPAGPRLSPAIQRLENQVLWLPLSVSDLILLFPAYKTHVHQVRFKGGPKKFA